MDTNVHDRALGLLLSRGVRFELPAPRCLKWLLPRSLIIRHLKCGTLLMIDRVATTHNLRQLLVANTSMEVAGTMVAPLSRAIAIAILNDYLLIKLLTRPLAWWLRWAVTPQGLNNLWQTIEGMADVRSFTGITTSMMRVTTLIVTTPTTMEGHDTKGS